MWQGWWAFGNIGALGYGVVSTAGSGARLLVFHGCKTQWPMVGGSLGLVLGCFGLAQVGLYFGSNIISWLKHK